MRGHINVLYINVDYIYKIFNLYSKFVFISWFKPKHDNDQFALAKVSDLASIGHWNSH